MLRIVIMDPLRQHDYRTRPWTRNRRLPTVAAVSTYVNNVLNICFDGCCQYRKPPVAGLEGENVTDPFEGIRRDEVLVLEGGV